LGASSFGSRDPVHVAYSADEPVTASTLLAAWHATRWGGPKRVHNAGSARPGLQSRSGRSVLARTKCLPAHVGQGIRVLVGVVADRAGSASSAAAALARPVAMVLGVNLARPPGWLCIGRRNLSRAVLLGPRGNQPKSRRLVGDTGPFRAWREYPLSRTR